jgi:hypothetical protein
VSATVLALVPFLEQRSMEQGERTLRQMLRSPAHLLQEYWPYILGGVVVILLLRAYLRR